MGTASRSWAWIDVTCGFYHGLLGVGWGVAPFLHALVHIVESDYVCESALPRQGTDDETWRCITVCRWE